MKPQLLIFILLFNFHAPVIATTTETFANALFSQNDFGVREGKRTDGVIVYHNGKNIFEKYARGFDENKKHIMWSVSKTITALLFGVAAKDGLVQLDQSICDFIEVQTPRFCKIKIRDLLTWTTAIEWVEEYEGTKNPRYSSVLAMLFGQGRKSMAQFVLSQPMVPSNEPGEIWRYSSGDTILAAYVLQKIFKTKNLRTVFNEKIFSPMGITNWLCEVDQEGTLSGSYYFYLTLPDMLKIGILLLQNGQYNKQVIVPATFIDFMRTTPAAYKTNRKDGKPGYISGASVWLNDSGDMGLPSPWPTLPKDTFAALGHWGQMLMIVPSQNLVAVRIADSRDGTFQVPHFAKAIADLMSSFSTANKKAAP